MTFLKEVSKMLEDRGEYVDAEALTPARTWVRYGGPGAAPVVTDGPHPETSDLVAGWYMIDVESQSARSSWRRTCRPSPALVASRCMSGSTCAR